MLRQLTPQQAYLGTIKPELCVLQASHIAHVRVQIQEQVSQIISGVPPDQLGRGPTRGAGDRLPRVHAAAAPGGVRGHVLHAALRARLRRRVHLRVQVPPEEVRPARQYSLISGLG